MLPSTAENEEEDESLFRNRGREVGQRMEEMDGWMGEWVKNVTTTHTDDSPDNNYRVLDEMDDQWAVSEWP